MKGFKKISKNKNSKIPEGIISIDKRNYLTIPCWAFSKVSSKKVSIWKSESEEKLGLEFQEGGDLKVVESDGMGRVSLSGFLREARIKTPDKLTYYQAQFQNGTLIINFEKEVEL